MKFEKEKQILENELLRRRKEEIGKLKNDFEAQLSALKLQVQKSDELRMKEVCLLGYYLFLIYYPGRVSAFNCQRGVGKLCTHCP